MSSMYDLALKEFEVALDEIESYLEFVVMANRVRPWLHAIINWDTLGPEQKPAIQGFLNSKEHRIEVGFNTLVIGISAAWESLIRRMIRDGVLWINTKYDHYDGIPERLRNQNLIRSGHAIATVDRPPAEVDYDYQLLCKNIGTCRKDGGMLVLNADAFAIGISTTNREQFDAFLKRIGLTIDWDLFGRAESLASHFDSRRTRDTTKAIEDRLEAFAKLRNRIAHSGQGVVTTESQVRSYISFFKLFGRSLVDAVEKQLVKNHPTTKRPVHT